MSLNIKPLKKHVIFREDSTYARQKSSIIHTIEPEVACIVEAVGDDVEHVKVGDRIHISGQEKKVHRLYPANYRFKVYCIPADEILAVYTA